jgi:DNA mismatch repair protein MutS
MSITVRYLHEYNKYKKQYGDKTLVLMQVGSFYELYATDTDGPKLKDIADLLNTVCTKKDKNVKEVSISNPYLVGFPMVATDKFVSLLVKNGYTLVMIDQVTPPPDPKREVTNIYSPSTYVGSTITTDSNYAVCIYFEYEKQKSNQNILCVGLSAIDITTGKVIIDETIPSLSDADLALDNTQRFISLTQPKEIFFVIKTTELNVKYDAKTLIQLLQLDERIVKIKRYDDKYSKIKFQSEFLSQIYNNKLNMSIIENLDLEKLTYARICLIMLIDFVQNYSQKLIKGLSEPEINIDSQHMILGNNATYQLSILENESFNYLQGTKFKCLYDVVNNANTGMGKRFIKNILTNPYIVDKKINEHLDLTEFMIENKLYDKYSNFLRQIIDIEKYKRKMNMQLLHPYELADFIESFKLIEDIIKNVKTDKINIKFKIIDKLIEFNKYCIDTFNVDELKKNLLSDIKKNLFNQNIYKDIDLLVEEYYCEHNMISDIKIQFDKILGETLKKKIVKSDKKSIKSIKSIKSTKSTKSIKKQLEDSDDDIAEYTKISNTPSEGYFITMSKQRYENLKKYFDKCDDDIIVGKQKLKFKDLKIKDLKNSMKIFIENSDDRDINDIEDKLLKLVHTNYVNKLKELYENYNDLFVNICDFIIKLDYITSNAITAKLYNYIKPQLKNNDTNFIRCKQVRHPIVERIIDYEYVPHDINLDFTLNGMLIYGLNSSGKSVMMKAVGLCLIMAQCGMYVPCTEFEFTIYNSIYTRITGNDNIFRGQSSFTLEMTELNSIIKRSDKKTLVIGDEICRGTENISGNAIVASTIIHLAKIKATFIFATHLHELVQLKGIRELDNVKAYHLSVDYDSKQDILIYDRTLKEGSGDKIYGILVAKYIIDNKDFIEQTIEIKNELTQSFSSLISGKKSRYNADVFVHKCEICGQKEEDGVSLLETHHINFQSKCKDGFAIDKPHIPMNSKANLIVICEKCHHSIHKDEIKIEKKVITSKGKRIL